MRHSNHDELDWLFTDLERIEREVSQGVLDYFDQKSFSKDVFKFLPLEIQELIPELRQIFLGTKKRLPKVFLSCFLDTTFNTCHGRFGLRVEDC